MKLSHHMKSFFVIASVVPAMLISITAAGAAGDPTQGRIQKRQAQSTAQYHECAGFALRVYQAARSQARGNSARIRAAEAHYHSNLARCRAKYL